MTNNGKYWAMLLILIVWMPVGVLAQTKKYELVVEKTDGTELVFKITETYPVMEYHYYDSTLGVTGEEGSYDVLCKEIKRLYTRVETEVITGIQEMSIGRTEEVYNLQGYKIRSKSTSLAGLPKGVYIVNGRKVIVK